MTEFDNISGFDGWGTKLMALLEEAENPRELPLAAFWSPPPSLARCTVSIIVALPLTSSGRNALLKR